MANSLLIDLDTDGSMRVSVLRGDDLPAAVSGDLPVVQWPLGAGELEDLRWYLEQYLALPYAVYEERGARVAAGLAGWGRRVFSSVFGAGPARDALVELRGSGQPFEVVFRSAAPGALGLPWELMQDPSRPAPMVLDGVRISRSLPTGGTGRSFQVGGERLRVLMVISRPAGASDVAYQMIARVLVSRLSALRGQVELVVLRPPTLDSLQAELARANAAGEPYQIVHFDGHGALSRSSTTAPGSGVFGGGAESGTLMFEKPQGGPDPVDAATFAQVLAAGRVPVVVLNACQSGAVGKELEAAVATRLLAQGARAVVAMAYSVYATAAAEFMAAFYERLFAGDLLSEAVVAGRARMARNNLRHSPKGPLALQDWLIPVHYKRSDVSFPQLKTTHTPARSLDDLLDSALDGAPPPLEQDALAPTEQFVGRDDLFYRIETALHHRRGVVLHGPGGTGKTELAKAFGRWAGATGAVDHPGWVVWHSFEPGVATFGLDGIVNSIGGHLLNARFHQLDPEQRLRVVTQALATNKVLLIWDNFESVASMPDPDQATPPLSEVEKHRLTDFLTQITTGAGKSVVILTSHTTEDWLDPSLVRLDVGGLTPDEAIEYANNLLAPLPIPQPRRDARDFADLLVWLDGHPLSMRLTLPHLVTRTPSEILAGLSGEAGGLPDSGGRLLGQVDRATRATSLTATITYSYRHLSQTTRQRLPALALLQGVADKDVLGLFSYLEEVPQRFRGTTVEEWESALEEGSRVGLLTPLGAGMYRIHPALPAYLSALWRDSAETDTDHATERALAETALLHAYAAFGGGWLTGQIQTGDAGLAFAVIGTQQGTLNRYLALALTTSDFASAQAILQPLNDYGEAQGDHAELDVWTDRVRLATETADGIPPSLDTDAGALWLFAVGAQANRLTSAGQLDQAQTIHETILGMLHLQPATETARMHMATGYHQLGMVAHHRGQLDEAKQWYRKSLTISEELDNRPGMAASYSQLGVVAQQRGELGEAHQWYHQSLTISKELDNRRGMAVSYSQLGMVAEEGDELGQADRWYRKSLTILQDLNDRPGIAHTHHLLGIVAQRRGELAEARQRYRQSLTINEELNNRSGIALNYHQLGMVAQHGGELGEAKQWYRQSLTINEELNNRPDMANNYGQMGLLAEESGDLGGALQWTVRAAALFEEFPHPLTGPAPAHLARWTTALGEPALARSWQQVTGQPLPDHVRRFVADAIQASQHEPEKEETSR